MDETGPAAPSDEVVNRVLWAIPNVLCLVGSRFGDEINAMTTSWVTQVAMSPVLVGAAIDAEAMTHRLIREGGAFSVNLWDRADTRVFVKFSKPATRDGDRLNERAIRYGVTGVPIFEEAIAFIECRVAHELALGSHSFFVGEVVDCGFRPGAEDALVARMEDTRMHYGGVLRGR
jgi:flavin reductase (DIM6/NTAB) family NADH-FMN oxidoreductase RutF